MQQFQSFRGQRVGEQGAAGSIATGPIEALDEAEFDWIVADQEDDRNALRPLLGRKRRGLAAGRNNCGNSTTDQVSRERRQSIESSLGPSVFDDDVSALDEPGFHQSFTERLREVGKSIGRSAVKKPDYRLHGLLRARRQRPRRRRTAEQRDELAPLHHSITSSRGRAAWAVL